jgi:hypothetical protein
MTVFHALVDVVCAHPWTDEQHGQVHSCGLILALCILAHQFYCLQTPVAMPLGSEAFYQLRVNPERYHRSVEGARISELGFGE